jgi:transcriptional regulator with XRE-family HTH domain
VAERRLIKELLILRAARGLSQGEVAAFVGCSQSRISKLENARDADVRFGDLQAYANAVGCDLVAQPVPREMEPTEKVKCHFAAIKKHMNDLAQLAGSDDNIAKGVAAFFAECFANLIWMFSEAAKRLPLRSDSSPYFRITCGETKEFPALNTSSESDDNLQADQEPAIS